MILFRDEQLNEELQQDLEEINGRAEIRENVADIFAEEQVAPPVEPKQEPVQPQPQESIPKETAADSESTPFENEVNSLLDELRDLERSLGMASADEEYPELKPISLPTFNVPLDSIVGTGVALTRTDIAQLNDEQFSALMDKLRLVEHLEAQVEAMRSIIDERLSVDFRAMYENLLEKSNIEAIKTYRNLQAVIIEENAKQNQALATIDHKANSLKKRMNHVLLFAIVSFVVSILVMLLQILPALGVKLF